MALTFFKSGEELWNMAFKQMEAKNYAEAADLFEKAHSKGYFKHGYGPLAYLYSKGLGVEKDQAKSFSLCLHDIQDNKEISKEGLRLSQYYIAFHYANGQGTAKDSEAATRMFKAAADNGHIESHYRYAKRVIKPVRVDMDAYFTARKYMKVALENCRSLSDPSLIQNSYNEWFGTLSDEDCKGLKSYEIHEMGRRFNLGLDSYPKDPEEAQRWFRKAVSLYLKIMDSDPAAMSNYAICLYNGLGVEQNRKMAREMLLKAADKGNEFGMKLLYDWFPEEKTKSLEKKASESEASLEDIIEAASCFYKAKEYKKAVEYAGKAINRYESSDGYAIYGAVSEYGLGTYKKDIRKAGEYYLKAAESSIKPIRPEFRFLICDYLFKVVMKEEEDYRLFPDTSAFIEHLWKFVSACCDDGNIYSKRMKGIILLQGKMYDEAYENLYEAYSKTGDLYAAKYLGYLHNLNGKYKDDNKMTHYYKNVVDNDFGDVADLRVYCRIIMNSFQEGTESYRKYLQKGVGYGDSASILQLGIYLATGEKGFWKDIEKAKNLFRSILTDPEYGKSAQEALRILQDLKN